MTTTGWDVMPVSGQSYGARFCNDANVCREVVDLRAEVKRLREALEHIAQSVGARANGADARAMAKFAREVLANAR